MVYNVTNLTNSEGFTDIVVELNTLAQPQGLFATFLLVAIFFITMATMRSEETPLQLLFSSFITLIFSVILFAIEMVSVPYIIVCIVLFIISIIYSVWTS